MACCALKKQKKQFMLLPIVLFLVSGVIGGLVVLILLAGGLVSSTLAEKGARTWRFLKELLTGLKTRILDQPFLFDSSFRCKVSGRLMRRSTLLAGAVYRYFNLIVLATLLFSFFSLVQGVRALGI
jgi:hypothetical protein